MRRLGLLLMALALVVPATAWAQARPDFSGTYKLSGTDPAGFKGSAGFGVPTPVMTIKQTATDVTVSAGFGDGVRTLVYKLDGSDLITEGPGASQSGASAIVKWRTRARFKGNSLVLYVWNTALNQERDTLTLNGQTLTIIRGIDQPGPSMTATVTYTKTTS